MRVYLVGADFEENLALGILAAVVERQGHQPRVVVFNQPSEIGRLVERITEDAPEVVGLSMQFQHRADEFLTLARGLRDAGFRGHITCGGQFPTLATAETLECHAGIDSVVLYDGEETLAELLAALETNQPLSDVAGLALLSDDGKAFRTASRPLIDDLDAVPIAKRYRPHSKHLDVPFIPITGGRGCWGRCSYCAIMSTYRDAKAQAGGRLLRLRSPESVAEEMAALWHAAGGQGIFCFHDENLLLPKPEASLERLRAIRDELDARGVDEIAIIGKCRPDSLTPELCRELPDLGVIRLYVGVENMSEAGARNFARARQREAVHQALAGCREADIFTCYNLLVFEPDATLEDVRENCEFMRTHPEHPVNFCRAEPYYGTPLHQQIARRQDLHGSFLGYNYRIADDRTEVLHRIVAAAFAERNFAPDGVINRYMSLGYNAKLLEWFHAADGSAAELRQRAKKLTVDITLDSARLLERAIGIAERNDPDDFDTIERQTGLLCLEVAKMDALWHAALDDIGRDMVAFVADPPAPRQRPKRARPHRVPAGFAVGMSMAITAAACGSSTTNPPADPAPGGMGGTAGSGGTGGNIADPAPGGMGGTVVDMAPGGMGGTGGAGMGGNIADPAPGGMGGTGGQAALLIDDDHKVATTSLPLVDHWRDSSARKAERTRDLPLFAPPKIALHATREREVIEVELTDPGVAYTAVWQAGGERIGEGLRCRWTPRGSEDRISVALRTEGGVAVATLGADEAGYG
jgi:radical SAM superfamily enzyme YgiQ (UPF0313 family)